MGELSRTLNSLAFEVDKPVEKEKNLNLKLRDIRLAISPYKNLFVAVTTGLSLMCCDSGFMLSKGV